MLYEIHHGHNIFVKMQVEYFDELEKNIERTNGIEIMWHLERETKFKVKLWNMSKGHGQLFSAVSDYTYTY